MSETRSNDGADPVPDELEERLTDSRVVAHLATCRDGRPHAAPLWFRYDDGTVDIMTTGRKLRDLRENPRVALSIQDDEAGHPAWMATLRGTATVVEDEDERTAANRRINRRYGAEDPDDWSENALVRIDVGSVTYRPF